MGRCAVGSVVDVQSVGLWLKDSLKKGNLKSCLEV